MATEETFKSGYARKMDEITLLRNEIAETKRQCELTKELVHRKIREMQTFCEEARQYLLEQLQTGKPGEISGKDQ